MILYAILNILLLRSVSLHRGSRISILCINQPTNIESIVKLVDQADDEFMELVGGHISVRFMPDSESGRSYEVIRRRGRFLIRCYGDSTGAKFARALDSLRRYAFNAK